MRKKTKKRWNWEKICFYSLIAIIISETIDLIKLAQSLIGLTLSTESYTLFYSSIYWNILTNIRLLSIEITIATGFILIYLVLRRRTKG